MVFIFVSGLVQDLEREDGQGIGEREADLATERDAEVALVLEEGEGVVPEIGTDLRRTGEVDRVIEEITEIGQERGRDRVRETDGDLARGKPESVRDQEKRGGAVHERESDQDPEIENAKDRCQEIEEIAEEVAPGRETENLHSKHFFAAFSRTQHFCYSI